MTGKSKKSGQKSKDISDQKDPDEECIKACKAVREEVEKEMGSLATFKPVNMRTQLVEGEKKYYVAVEIGSNNYYPGTKYIALEIMSSGDSFTLLRVRPIYQQASSNKSAGKGKSKKSSAKSAHH